MVHSGTNDYREVSRSLYLLQYTKDKFENEDYYEDFKPGKLEPIFNLPLRHHLPDFVLPDIVSRYSRDQWPYDSSCSHPDKFQIISSCKGILCLCAPSKNDPDVILICNPITGEYIKIPGNSDIEDCRDGFTQIGFGFPPETEEYVVVKMFKTKPPYIIGELWKGDTTYVMIHVHTVGTTTWKRIEGNIEFPAFFDTLDCPTCVSGSVHWVGRENTPIWRFDLENERFEPFPTPPHGTPPREYDSRIRIGECKGSLFFCDRDHHSVTIWVLHNYGQPSQQWIPAYTIDDGIVGDFFMPVKLCDEKGVVLEEVTVLFHAGSKYFYEYGGNHDQRALEIRGIGDKEMCFETIQHIPNINSLKDVIKGDNLEVLNVGTRYSNLIYSDDEIEETYVLSMRLKNRADYTSSDSELVGSTVILPSSFS